MRWWKGRNCWLRAICGIEGNGIGFFKYSHIGYKKKIRQNYKKKMVLVNYQKFIEQKIMEQVEKYTDTKLIKICQDIDFKELLIKLYQYCEQINIIEERMDVLAKETQKIKGLRPKLLDSQVTKIEQKTKQISSCYSIFLIKQPRFRISSQQSSYYENFIKIVLTVMQKCFNKQNFIRLKKQINRLLRTNTFNKKICWQQFYEKTQSNPQMSKKKKKLAETDFKAFRRYRMLIIDHVFVLNLHAHR